MREMHFSVFGYEAKCVRRISPGHRLGKSTHCISAGQRLASFLAVAPAIATSSMRPQNTSRLALVRLALVCVTPLFLLVVPAEAQTTNATAYIWETFAGYAGLGSADGVGGAAQLNGPAALTSDTNGNIYVADTFNDTIRKLTPAGVMTTIAGFPGAYETLDGTNGNARFSSPDGIIADSLGNLYVAQYACVRLITPFGSNWVVTTIAGQPGSPGSADGPGPAARFGTPLGTQGMAMDPSGVLFVADPSNRTIRKIAPTGINWSVSTFVGSPGRMGSTDGAGTNALFGIPMGVALDALGNLFVADKSNDTIRKATPAGIVTTIAGLAGHSGTADGTNGNARFLSPTGLAAASDGTLYVLCQIGTLRKIVPAGTNWIVSTIAGGSPGSADGTGTNASFSSPYGLALDRYNDLWVADSGNSTIREATTSGVVWTIAGTPSYGRGSANGTGEAARFNTPVGLAVDNSGTIFVADTLNHTIRRITSAGIVTTWAGAPGLSGSADGVGSSARFNYPEGLFLDNARNLYVADRGNYTIRRIDPAGTVTTVSGQPGVVGSADGVGTNALFYFPRGVAGDSNGNVYVADSDNATIRQITSNGVVATIAGRAGQLGTMDGTGTNALFGSPRGIVIDPTGRLYVADETALTIRKLELVGSNWVVTTIAGQAGQGGGADGVGTNALFTEPDGIALDTSGNLYLADGMTSNIRKLSPSSSGWVVTTVGGLAYRHGSADGPGSAASFLNPQGIALGPTGEIFVSDTGNSTIRKGSFVGYSATNPVPYSQPAMNGQLSVTPFPVEAKGQWRLPWELGWRSNAQVASNLVAGNYEIQFRALPGWLAAPPTISIQVTNGGLTPVSTNVYYPTLTPSDEQGGAGSLMVNLGATPPQGAGWRFLGDTTPFLPPGYTTNLLPGTYLIEFAGPFSGRVTPPNASVQVFAGQPTVISVNYFLAANPPGGVLLPRAVAAPNISDLTDYPFGFNGQLRTDVGYGSGVAAQPNVVLTAAHLVFNDQNLSYVSAAWWFFQQETGVFSPLPTQARAFYVLSGYGAQRTNDLLSGLYGPDQSTPQSRNLDVAALYFDSYVANGGYGGYLPSAASPNSWLASSSLKMLVGYPVDGSLLGDASIVAGQMYQTDPQPYPLSIATDPNVANQQVYTAPWFLSHPGNSGGPFYVQFNGYFYPAGVYLGTLYSGTQPYASAVRAIDSGVVNLIAIAQADAGTGTNNTGGGVVTIIAAGVSASNPGYVQFQLGPPAAVQAGAAWRLSCTNCDTSWSFATNYTLAVTTTNALSVQYKPIPGWNLPTNQTVSVSAGQLATPSAIYTDMPAMLSYKAGEGLRLSGASGLAYRIEYATNLNSPTSWAPLTTVTNPLTTNTTVVVGTQPAPGTRFFRAAKAQ